MNSLTASNSDWSPLQLQQALHAGQPLLLLDVREEPEFAAGRIPGSHPLPLASLEAKVGELDRSRPLVLVCRSGKRAAQARAKLASLGFEQLALLSGGVMAWEAAGLPLEKDDRAPWALERQVRLAAGSMVLLGVTLGFMVNPAFFGLAGFVGVGLVFAGLTDWCGMGLLLAKAPWNRRSQPRCRT